MVAYYLDLIVKVFGANYVSDDNNNFIENGVLRNFKTAKIIKEQKYLWLTLCFCLQIYNMSGVNLTRSDSNLSAGSVQSFCSDDLETELSTYTEAPRDIFGEVDGLGKVLIAKYGEELPKDTKYKATKDSKIAVKFRYDIGLMEP